MASAAVRRIGIALLGISALAFFAAAQRPKSPPRPLTTVSHTAGEIRVWREANEMRVMNELRALLEIPNFASDRDNIRLNADKLEKLLRARGFETQLWEIEHRGPVVFGELKTPNAKRTIIFYMHYDGQSVDPATWTGTKPYEPTLRDKPLDSEGQIISFPTDHERYNDDWRLYARSAADDKSPIVALLASIDALRARKISIGANVKVVFDGEEEAGSPHLEKTLMDHHDLLEGDLLINGDGPVHQSGRMQVLFGNRGIVRADITVYGPLHSLHSGHYGNWAPNPAMRLAQLLASMKDDNGHVRIAGFYDGVTDLGPTAQLALKEMPENDAELGQDLGINTPEGGGKHLVELITQPSLNIDGLRSEDVGEQARTIIPERAMASVDMRLVKNISPREQFERLVAHIRKQGYYVTSGEPRAEDRRRFPKIARVEMSAGAYPASFTSMDLPVSKALVDVVNAAVGGGLIRMPMSGGSSPMYIFENLGLPVINVPIVNYDDNQHSPNENLRIGNLWQGMEVYGTLLADLKW